MFSQERKGCNSNCDIIFLDLKLNEINNTGWRSSWVNKICICFRFQAFISPDMNASLMYLLLLKVVKFRLIVIPRSSFKQGHKGLSRGVVTLTQLLPIGSDW